MLTAAATGLVDAHNHLQEEILVPYLPAVLSRARAAGVTRQMVNGTSETDWPEVLALARDHADLTPSFGLHPWFVATRSAGWLEVLRDYLSWAPSAVGEVGLDRLAEDRDEALQEEVFRAQLQLARELARPVSIHCVRAWGWLLEVLRDEGPPPAGLLLHAYGGAPDLLPELTAMSAYYSFGGNALDPRRKRARAALSAAPLERLLLESDAPAMPAPEEYRPGAIILATGEVLSEPAHLPAIAGGIAALRGVPVAELIELTAANARRLWGDLA